MRFRADYGRLIKQGNHLDGFRTHKELKGTGEDLPQNDRGKDVWFRTNYGRLIKQTGHNVHDSSRHFIQTKNSNM